MSRIIAATLLCLVASNILAGECEYDFNQDEKCDSYSVRPIEETEGMSNVTISLNGIGDITGKFNTGSAGIAPGYFPEELIIPLDYYSPHDTIQSVYTFRWNDELKTFLLKKESTWSEPYRSEEFSLNNRKIPPEARFPQDFEVKRIECCASFSDFNTQTPKYKQLNEAEARESINDDISEIKKYLADGKNSKLFYNKLPPSEENRKPIPPDLIFELGTAITKSNVEALNDYAFYMQQSGNNVLAANLLEQIHNQFPQRVVTTLNLADSYWALDMKDSACHLYGEYRKRMMAIGKKDRIPKHVTPRSDCAAYTNKNN